MTDYHIAKLVKIGFEEEITVVKVPGWLASCFGAKTELLKFQGSGTVWHQVPTGQRPGTCMEGYLANLVAGYKIRNNPVPE